jgi:integrase
VAYAVKLVPEEKTSPQQKTEKEEADLVATVQQQGSLRDRAIILLMLHTGLRTMEVCNLKPGDVMIHHAGLLSPVQMETSFFFFVIQYIQDN